VEENTVNDETYVFYQDFVGSLAKTWGCEVGTPNHRYYHNHVWRTTAFTFLRPMSSCCKQALHNI
jgi:hypothetical protein